MTTVPRDENGEVLTVPERRIVRWTAARKKEVLDAIDGGLLSEEDALRRYSLTKDEIEHWRLRRQAHGVTGLHEKHYFGMRASVQTGS